MAISLITKLRAKYINNNYKNALLTGYGLMGLTIAIQLVLVPLYLNHLGKERFGILTMIMAANNYAAIGIAWLSGSMARILAEKAALNDRPGFRNAYAFTKLTYVSYAAITVTLFWLIAPWLFPNALSDSEIRVSVILSCVYFILAYEYNADRQAFIARHLQSRANLNEAAGQVVFALVVSSGLYMNIGLPGIVSAQIAGMLCTRLLALLYWRRDDYLLGWQRRIAGWRELWERVTGRVGRDYILYGFLVLTLQSDALIIGWIAGAEATAQYYLLWRIPEVCILLLWKIPGTYAPHFIAMDARKERATLQSSYFAGLGIMIALAGAIALVYALAGQWMVSLWVGQHAITDKLSYAFAGSALFFIALSKWPAELAHALMNTRPLIKIALFETTTKLILFWWLFKKYNYLSPLIATTITHVSLICFLYMLLGYRTAKHHF